MATRQYQPGNVSDFDTGPAKYWAAYPSLANSKLFDEYANRLVSGRDMHVIITAASETGVGKTTLAVVLALLWDQHGWTPDKAAVADAMEYTALYDNVPPGSVLLLDEAEIAADNRRGMKKSNVAVSQAFAAKRYRQVFGILTAPSKQWVDKRLGGDSADYWIQAQETDRGKPKGEAIVYRLKSNEHYKTHYAKRHEMISWPRLDTHPAFIELDRRKRATVSNDHASTYVHRDEVERLKQNYGDKAMKQSRYGIVKALADHGITQTETARILKDAEYVDGLSQTTVSRLLKTDSFEEAYN